MTTAIRDENHVPVALGVSDADATVTLPLTIDDSTGRLLVDMAGGGTGDVIGPASSTDNAIARFNGTDGKTIQNSGIIIDDSNNLLLVTSDGGALGSGTKMWSDGFFASGAVINFNNGDVTLTHSADTLTLGGGTLALGTNSLTLTGSIAATGARVTKGWFTDVESTNMYTVGGTSLSSTFSPIAGSASIVTVGTITSGAWNGTDIPVTAGGTGLSAITALSIWVANSANTITEVTPGAGNSIRINGAGNAWEAFTPSADVPTTITVANEATDTSCFPLFVTAATGDLGPKTNAGLSFNSNTATLTATAFVGPLTGDVTGNVSGTAATVTGAAQTAITSLGTLTALDVDNININGNTISSTAGTDLLITPLAGQQLILDGTIIVDAGEVLGITSLGVTGTRVTAGFFTDLTVTNAIAGSITGTAAVGTAVTAADEATDTSCFITFVTAATGNLGIKTNTNMTFNSNTGVATFASTVLTTTDINGGTVDGAVIGGASAAAITGTTIDATTDFTIGGTVITNNTITDDGTLIINATTATSFSDGNITNVGDIALDSLTADATNITLNSPLQLIENMPIMLDAAGSADGKYSGITIAGTAGATLAFGDLVYLAAADSRWELADADAASTSGDVILGMCVLAAASDGDPTRLLLIGNIRADAAFPALTISAPAYVGVTAGDIQVAQPSGTDDVIRRVGFALTADELYFNPSNDYATHI